MGFEKNSGLDTAIKFNFRQLWKRKNFSVLCLGEIRWFWQSSLYYGFWKLGKRVAYKKTKLRYGYRKKGSSLIYGRSLNRALDGRVIIMTASCILISQSSHST